MNDVLSTNLHDGELLAEIDLATELIIAATESDGPLAWNLIDDILRVRPEGG